MAFPWPVLSQGSGVASFPTSLRSRLHCEARLGLRIRGLLEVHDIIKDCIRIIGVNSWFIVRLMDDGVLHNPR